MENRFQTDEMPIYERIAGALVNGELPRGFSLPSEETGIRFADGAMDGIAIYHMGRQAPDTAAMQQMILALREASACRLKEADAAFTELGKRYRAISLAEALPAQILEHQEVYSADNLFETALYLVRYSKDREAVKFGLSMLGVFVMDVEAQKDVVRTLGLSDEFTLFAVWNMMNWEDPAEEIFRLCKKVHGWGRIHALERLDPVTEEIRAWILKEGVKNDVLPAYSAYTAWEKAGVRERLYGPLEREDYAAIGRIFQALLDEGPVRGISLIEDAEECIHQYIRRSDEFLLGDEEAEVIEELQEWLEGEAGRYHDH